MTAPNVRRTLLLFIVATSAGCSNPRSTKIPSDIAQLPSIQSSLDKLDSADRNRVASYEMRAHMGAIFGNNPPPASVTIGEAIDNQKAFEAEEAKKEAAEKQVAAAAAAKHAEEVKALDAAAVVGLVSKGSEAGGFMGDVITFTLAMQNRSGKDIAGIKGDAVFRDLFGDTLAVVTVSSDVTIRPGATSTFAGRIGTMMGNHQERKLLTTPFEKVKFSFDPEMIVFSDGSKLQAAPAAP